MTNRTRRPLSRARIWTCILTNQTATPGLGSLMARRIVVGTGQLLLALVGFFLIMGWMFKLFHRVSAEQLGDPIPPNTFGWMGRWGTICFGASWLWSLVTSFSLWRQAKTDEAVEPRPVPPRLGSPGQPPKLS